MPPSQQERPSFLPINTNLFDRIFIGVVVGIALHLLWMRFLEHALPLSLCTLITVALGWLIAKRG